MKVILKQLCLLVLFFILTGCDKETGEERVTSDSPDASVVAEPVGTNDDGQSDSAIIGDSPESPRIPVDPEYPDIPIPGGPIGPGGTDVIDTGNKCPKNCENLIFTKCYANCKHCGSEEKQSACRDMCLNSCVSGQDGELGILPANE